MTAGTWIAASFCTVRPGPATQSGSTAGVSGEGGAAVGDGVEGSVGVALEVVTEGAVPVFSGPEQPASITANTITGNARCTNSDGAFIRSVSHAAAVFRKPHRNLYCAPINVG